MLNWQNIATLILILFYFIFFFITEKKFYWIIFILIISWYINRHSTPPKNMYTYLGLVWFGLVWFGLVLWHVNHCWLFNAKSYFYYIYQPLRSGRIWHEVIF